MKTIECSICKRPDIAESYCQACAIKGVDNQGRLEALIVKLTAQLEAHRRFHKKVGCPGGADCYVCAREMTYKEYRKDGWPLCPQCGDDELYSKEMLAWTGKGERPTLEQCVAGEMACYKCNWHSWLASATEG